MDEATRCFVVTYHEAITISERLDALRKAIPIIIEEQPVGVVVDLRRCSLPMQVPEAFNFGKRLAMVPPLRSRRVAYVVEDPTSDKDELVELVASNRGLFTARFASLEEALAWASSDGEVTD